MTDKFYSAEIEGYASIFNHPDDNGDVVAPGAFRNTLSSRSDGPVRMLYQHDVSAPIGRWTALREDARGLFVRGALLLNSEKAREVYALLEGGAIDGLSIGFQTVTATRGKEGRRITRAALWEVSIVTFPMARAARITRVGRPQPVSEALSQHPPRPMHEPSCVEGDVSAFANGLRDARAVLSTAA